MQGGRARESDMAVVHSHPCWWQQGAHRPLQGTESAEVGSFLCTKGSVPAWSLSLCKTVSLMMVPPSL